MVCSSMRGDEAKEVCPQVNLVQVPVARGKADLNIYRNAGSEVCGIWSASLLIFTMSMILNLNVYHASF